MRAVGISKPGGPEVVEVRDVPEPTVSAEDVLVRVHAAGTSEVDLEMRKRRPDTGPGAAWAADPNRAFSILGREFAGEVVGLGSRVSRIKQGDRVMAHIGGSVADRDGFAPGGGQAELVAVHYLMVSKVPENLTWTEAGSIPYAFNTAQFTLAESRLVPGDRVLVHSVSSGVGSATIQIAKAMGASLVIGTSSSDEKLEKAKAIGLDVGVNHQTQDFVEEVARATNNEGVDVIIDVVGLEHLEKNIRAAAKHGRISCVGGSLARNAAQQDFHAGLRLIGQKHLNIRGGAIGNLPLDQRAITVRAFEKVVIPALADGRIKPVVDSVYSYTDAKKAHTYRDTYTWFGKVVLIP